MKYFEFSALHLNTNTILAQRKNNMKKILLGAALVALSSLTFAQKKINEGSITYKVEYDVPANMQMMKAMMPDEIKVYFKGDSTSMINKSPMVSSVFIMNAKTESQRLLLDIPMMSKKYSVRFTPDEIETMKENFPQLSFSEAGQKKAIASFAGTTYTVTDKKSGQSSEVVFTKDVDIPVNSLTQYFDKNYGVPLAFQSIQQGMKVKATVKEIKEEKVPAGSFSAGKDYEEITYKELQGMMPGKR
jgi:hypothetical protein